MTRPMPSTSMNSVMSTKTTLSCRLRLALLNVLKCRPESGQNLSASRSQSAVRGRLGGGGPARRAGHALGLRVAELRAQEDQPRELVRGQVHLGSAEAVLGVEAAERAELREIGVHDGGDLP